ncbi:hypothetical protein [Desulfonema magnum]|uniref:STAS/SEC14 domain-containing protein n=1 Tax=Desulfonema magnum TaxID=45655 RepID=A0A975BTY7_9BACT|nr:hypothetical protein [Desulfonema magnum]QTA91696.1 Uncharacterized protein dnm_077690 [Desulfonema magnum]
MNNTIYMKEGYVKVNYKPETGVVYILWKNLFNQDIVRECCERQLEEVHKGAKILVANISNAKGVVLEETQKWFKSYLFPAYAKAGLKAIITIDSKVLITRLTARRWTQVGSRFVFDMVTVRSKEEAAKTAANYL